MVTWLEVGGIEKGRGMPLGEVVSVGTRDITSLGDSETVIVIDWRYAAGGTPSTQIIRFFGEIDLPEPGDLYRRAVPSN